jgi:hypothetical protein
MMMRDYNQYRVQRARVVGWCWERLGGHAVMPECGRVVKGAVCVWRLRTSRHMANSSRGQAVGVRTEVSHVYV